MTGGSTLTAASLAHASTGWTYSRAVPEQAQQQGSWCAPASAVASLASIGVTTTQAQNALGMDTSAEDGTTGDAIVAYGNSVTPLSHVKYFIDDDGSAALMQEEVSYEISKGYVPMIGVWTDLLPWYPASYGHYGHVLAIVGDDTATGQAEVWDPNAQGYGGLTIMSFTALWNASQGPSGDETTHGLSIAMEPTS